MVDSREAFHGPLQNQWLYLNKKTTLSAFIRNIRSEKGGCSHKLFTFVLPVIEAADLRQEIPGVHFPVFVVHHFEVQVGAAGFSGAAHNADGAALEDTLPAGN